MHDVQWRESEKLIIAKAVEDAEKTSVSAVARYLVSSKLIKRSETAVRHRLHAALKRRREQPLRILAEVASRSPPRAEFKEAVIAQAMLQEQMLAVRRTVGSLVRLALADDQRIRALEKVEGVTAKH
jgi:hypothetical protein